MGEQMPDRGSTGGSEVAPAENLSEEMGVVPAVSRHDSSSLITPIYTLHAHLLDLL